MKKMKKVLAFLLTIMMASVSTVAFAETTGSGGRFITQGDYMYYVPAGASNINRNIPKDKIAFFLELHGLQIKTGSNICDKVRALFTDIVALSDMKQTDQKVECPVVKGDGVTEEDVLVMVADVPDADTVFENTSKQLMDQGYIISGNGDVIPWSKLNSKYYAVEWTAFRHPADGWHVDGTIIDLETKETIDVIVPEDPKDIPPAAYDDPSDEPNDEPSNEPDGEAFEYTSNFAYIYGYNDNTMAADNNLRRSEVSAMVHRLVKQNNKLGGFVYSASNPPAFDDIEGEWFRSGIEFINYKGAFADDSNVYPYVDVTRGETFKIICLGLGFSENTGLSYEDYAAILQKAGYIQGDENGDLNIQKLITRAEFCTIYNRIIGRDNAKLVTADGVEITPETYGFSDLQENKWYYETMLRATSSYDDDGYVDIALRNQRNILDDYQ